MVATNRYEEDDYAGEDRGVMLTPGGSAVVLPRSAQRLKGEALETYARLMKVGRALAELEREARDDLVPAAREAGLSWSLVGAALGITGEGARLRYAEDQDG